MSSGSRDERTPATWLYLALHCPAHLNGCPAPRGGLFGFAPRWRRFTDVTSGQTDVHYPPSLLRTFPIARGLTRSASTSARCNGATALRTSTSLGRPPVCAVKTNQRGKS